jgi:membrane protein DedA with SNARE-associated domain
MTLVDRRGVRHSDGMRPARPTHDEPAETASPAPTVWRRRAALTALVVPQGLALLVQGVAPLLLREAPLVLLALHPFEPWSLLVSTRTGIVAFLAVVVAVRAVACCGGYLVGRWYGPRALMWLSRRARTGRAARTVQHMSAWAGPLLLLYPGATASVLAGVNGLPVRRFLPLMVTGIVLAALLTRLLAVAAAGPLTAAAAVLDRWAGPAGLVLLALVALVQLRPRRGRDRW